MGKVFKDIQQVAKTYQLPFLLNEIQAKFPETDLYFVGETAHEMYGGMDIYTPIHIQIVRNIRSHVMPYAVELYGEQPELDNGRSKKMSFRDGEIIFEFTRKYVPQYPMDSYLHLYKYLRKDA